MESDLEKPRLQGLDAEELAKKFETPLYVYDGDMAIQRYKELFDFIKWPKLRILYAMKANYNPMLLRILKNNGAMIDAVSPGDVILALKIGFKPEQILYTANNITDDEMREVHDQKIMLNIDSLSRLEKYGKEFQGTEVCLRFNPEVEAGEHAKVRTGGDLTKFGLLFDDLVKIKSIVSNYNLKVVGLHEHTGSGISDTGKIMQSMKNLLNIVTKENFPDLRFVDFGGGFKVPYKPDEKRIDYSSFGNKILEIFKIACKKYGRELELWFEPGKYIVAESGTLLVRVNTLKDNHGRLIAGTDSGFSQLIRPMFYNAYHHILNLSNPNGPLKKYDIAGNICETGDLFAKDREMPEIREGDLLAVQNAGAYCYAMGSVYNLRAMPAEVVIRDGKVSLARKGLSSKKLVKQILHESWLK
ncbi:MAG: diaminopimelate decarboxylase [Candidatus Woesearchaeota archaeon]